jgi:hypothetical protein
MKTTRAMQIATVILSMTLGFFIYAPRLTAMKAAHRSTGKTTTSSFLQAASQSSPSNQGGDWDAGVSQEGASTAIPLFVRIGSKVQKEKAICASEIKVLLYLEGVPAS